jgi:hypothetical protein
MNPPRSVDECVGRARPSLKALCRRQRSFRIAWIETPSLARRLGSAAAPRPAWANTGPDGLPFWEMNGRSGRGSTHQRTKRRISLGSSRTTPPGCAESLRHCVPIVEPLGIQQATFSHLGNLVAEYLDRYTDRAIPSPGPQQPHAFGSR